MLPATVMFAVAVMFAVPLRGSAISRVGGDLEGNGTVNSNVDGVVDGNFR